MVLSINPTAEKTHAQFKQLAIAQNGTGEAAPIVGGPPAAAPPAASPVAPPPPAGTTPAQGGVATGIGQVGGDGTCSCSCLCGVASFPNPGVQGRNAWGGFSGQ